MGWQPRVAHRPPTRYEHLRDRWIHDAITIEEFEEQVGELILTGTENARQPFPIPFRRIPGHIDPP